ncbi:MAG: HD-GYP domain-containing protein [Treponema sp.]|nr:HD-GYP domain-containing protein [Treponema sp.]
MFLPTIKRILTPTDSACFFILAVPPKKRNELLVRQIVIGCLCLMLQDLHMIFVKQPFIDLNGIILNDYVDFFIVLMYASLFGSIPATVVVFINFIADSILLRGFAFSNFGLVLCALIASVPMQRHWYYSTAKSIAAAIMFSIILGSCWSLLFMVVENEPIKFHHAAIQFLNMMPASALTVFLCRRFFLYAPDKIKEKTFGGLFYIRSNDSLYNRITSTRAARLSFKLSVLIFCMTLFLIVSGIMFVHILLMPNPRNDFFAMMHAGPHDPQSSFYIKLILLMLNATVPFVQVVNLFAQINIAIPVRLMSTAMRDFTSDVLSEEQESVVDIHLLNIHTHDEIEDLHKTLKLTSRRILLYIEKLQHEKALEEQVIVQEQRSAKLTKEFMLALAKTVDAKDHYTSGHSLRVAKYAKEIARRMGKSEDEQEEIFTMGLLHDIGKIGVSEAIINKQGKLTEEEFQKIKEHPTKGYEILKNVSELPTIANGARWHHERFDGRGYPDGLKGYDIPEEARIIAVADAYDAMTSKRAYSDVRPQDVVRSEIIRCRGSQFDPQIADIFVSMIDDDPEYKMHEF